MSFENTSTSTGLKLGYARVSTRDQNLDLQNEELRWSWVRARLEGVRNSVERESALQCDLRARLWTGFTLNR